MLPIAVLAVGAVLLVAGLIMLISGSGAEGSSAAKLVLACASAVAVIAGIILYISNRNELKNLAKEGTELRQKRSDLELKIKDTQVSVEEFLDRFKTYIKYSGKEQRKSGEKGYQYGSYRKPY